MSNEIPFSRPASPGATTLQVGWYGLGNMGSMMAKNLAKNNKSHPAANGPILVYNRSSAKAEKLVKEVGASAAKIAESPAQLVQQCDIIFTNLANDTVVTTVYNEFAKVLHQSPPTKNKIFVDTSTVYPTLSGQLDKLISSFPNTHFVTSPVFGPPTTAEKAQLVIALAGDYASKKEVAYLLVPAVGRKALDLGENVEKAPIMKLIGNSLIMGFNELISEAFTFGDKAGIGAQTVLNLIKEILPAPSVIAYGERMVNDKFDGSNGFNIDGGIKDSNHIRKLSAELNSPMPTIDVAHQRMVTARAIFEGQKSEGANTWDIIDWSALIGGSRVAAGLDPFDSTKFNKVAKET